MHLASVFPVLREQGQVEYELALRDDLIYHLSRWPHEAHPFGLGTLDCQSYKRILKSIYTAPPYTDEKTHMGAAH